MGAVREVNKSLEYNTGTAEKGCQKDVLGFSERWS